MDEILIVDDEPMIRSMMDTALSSMGYSVTGAGSVEEAIELFESDASRFDALVTDYNLADGTGLEIVKTVREREANTPVILMTGSMKIGRTECLENGFSAYFHKPFSCVDIGKELNELLSVKAS